MNAPVTAFEDIMRNGNLHLTSNQSPNLIIALAEIANQNGTHLTIAGKYYTFDILQTVAKTGGKNVTIVL